MSARGSRARPLSPVVEAVPAQSPRARRRLAVPRAISVWRPGVLPRKWRPVTSLVRLLFAVGTALLALAACVPIDNGSGAATIIVTPASIRAGFAVEVSATCSDNANPAHVTSNAFGSLTLSPQHGLLDHQVTVPASTAPGTYDVRLECASGARSSATLTVLGTGTAAKQRNTHLGPATGGGEMAGNTAGNVLVGGLVAAGAGALILIIALRRRPAMKG